MKEEAIEQVLVGIRKVLAGEIFLSERMKDRMLQQMAGNKGKVASSPIELLTDREIEVFRLIGEGHSTRQIADHLHVGFKTVQAYCARIKEKLKLANATELLRAAIQWNENENRPGK